MLNATPTPITPPRVPLIDPRTGLIDRSWYMFFLSLFSAAQGEDNPAPNASSLIASYDAALAAVAQEAQTLPVQQQYAPQDVAEPPITPYSPQDVIEMVRPDLTAELAALRQEVELLPAPIIPLPTTDAVTATKLITSPNEYAFTGADVASGASVATFSSTVPTGSSPSTNKWMEVIIDTTSWWIPIWSK